MPRTRIIRAYAPHMAQNVPRRPTQVMVHMWLKLETMKGSGKWEADLLQNTDEDLTWEQITSLDEN